MIDYPTFRSNYLTNITLTKNNTKLNKDELEKHIGYLLEKHIESLYEHYLISEKKGNKKMITVALLINGNPLAARSAVNTGKKKGKNVIYRNDDGGKILHNPDDGAVKLAIKMLETIKEFKS